MHLGTTAIRALRTCPRMYRFSQVEGIVPVSESGKLVAGRGGHAALQAYYSGQTIDLVAFYNAWLETEYARGVQIDPKTEEDANLVRRVLGGYVEWAREEDAFRVLGTEVDVELEADTEVFKSRFDALVQLPNEGLWVLEHKFLKYFPDEAMLQLDEQSSLYVAAAEKAYPEQRVEGVIYNVVRKSDPARSRNPIYRRFFLSRCNAERQSAYNHLVQMVKLRAALKEIGYPPSPGQHCQWMCGYRDLCIACNQGINPADLVGAGMRWDYRKQEEEDEHGSENVA